MRATPNEKTTIDLTLGQRALGKMVDLRVIPEIEESPIAGDMARDVFWNYFLPEPNYVPTDELVGGQKLNSRILEWVRESTGWESSKLSTVQKLVPSVISTQIMSANLMNDDVVKDALKKEEEAEQKREEAQQEREQAKEKQNEAQEAAESGDNDKSQELSQQAAEKNAKADSLDAEADALSEQASSAFGEFSESAKGGAVRAKAIKEGEKASDEALAFMRGWGLDPSDPTELPEIMDFLSKSPDDFLKKVAALIGRMKSIAMKHAKKPSQEKTGVIVQDGYTRDPLNIFVGEKAYLRPDAPDFLRAIKTVEYCDRGLTGMIDGAEKKEKGVLVIAVDESGSMSGNRIMKAKGLTIGIGMAAKDNGQLWEAFGFATSASGISEVNDTSSPKELMQWSKSMLSGGTDFNFALKNAIDKVEARRDDVDNADIVMITDGSCGTNQETIAKLRDMRSVHGTRLILLLVGGIESDMESLDEIASAKIYMDDRKSPDEVAEELSIALNEER